MRSRLAAWIDAIFWPELAARQLRPSVAEIVAPAAPTAPPHVPPMPDDYRALSREHAAATVPERSTRRESFGPTRI